MCFILKTVYFLREVCLVPWMIDNVLKSYTSWSFIKNNKIELVMLFSVSSIAQFYCVTRPLLSLFP